MFVGDVCCLWSTVPHVGRPSTLTRREASSIAKAFEVRYDPDSISSMAFWQRPESEQAAVFERLRETAPVSWQPAPENSLEATTAGAGYWAVVRHSDIQQVSRDPATFAAGFGVALDDIPLDLQTRVTSLLAMDAPRHTRLRRVIGRVFTARRVAEIEASMQVKATEIVDALLERGPCDFIEAVSTQLPSWISSEVMGVPPADRAAAVAAASTIVGRSDPSFYGELSPAAAMTGALETLEGIGRELLAARRRDPRGDLMSRLAHEGEADEDPLTDEEIVSCFVILTLAGNQTTNDTTGTAMLALCEFPEERRRLAADFENTQQRAIEEFLRWSTPTIALRRTATVDTEIAGQSIAAGDKVVMFYNSGNRDATVFDDAYHFDITRNPNPHLGFGGGGVHHCVGAPLARASLRTIFRELLTRVPDIEVSDPEYLLSNIMHSIVSMPCTFSRTALNDRNVTVNRSVGA
jgi:cytochrome P450